MYQTFIKTALVAGLAMAMAGCDTKTIKPTERKAAKLAAIEAPMNVLSQVSSVRLDSGKAKTNKKTQSTSELQPAVTATGWIAASRGGVLAAFAGGAKLWQVQLADSVTGGVGLDSAETLAVVGLRSGQIVAVDAKTGVQRWTVNLPSASLSPALVIADKTVVSTNNGMVYALDNQTGKTIWQYATQAPNTSVRGIAKPLALDAGTILIGGADGRIHALDAATGTPVWARRIGLAMGTSELAKLRDVDGTPIVVGNHLYASSYSGQLMGFDMTTGRTMFSSTLPSTTKLTVVSNAIIGSSVNGELVAFDRITGAKLWDNNELKYRGLSNPVSLGQYIAVADKQGVVHILNAQGKIISRVDAKSGLTNLQVVQNRLYAQSVNDTVHVWQF
ncbi:Beta-barrel assembly machine subunit BamB [Moraxella cuniculi DSM 21768]|uniref:Outer membrane protein assembly factor BamB n=1 Tax=Moraxella cuniculi DSM 21768 TaxID=1122245 RepID=A0A1N7ETN3_9GAMM|nr:outer membrane protein assembly factor BamB [Moraxella cuniculi]OOS06347.1 outer membrane protein assembly factor BamB [Moraxella cuniculi]SIR91488.1 Beta-barrel assembly machine subunit BamB [Moraxella cuniculi DSM 21768]